MVTEDELRAYIASQHVHTVHHALGIEITELGRDLAEVRCDVDERLFQHAGQVHGGIFALLGESAASTSAAFNVDIATQNIAGQEVNANHLRAVTEGTLVARARPVHRGRTSLVYRFEVENLVDDAVRLCAVGRVTIAVRARSHPVDNEGVRG